MRKREKSYSNFPSFFSFNLLSLRDKGDKLVFFKPCSRKYCFVMTAVRIVIVLYVTMV